MKQGASHLVDNFQHSGKEGVLAAFEAIRLALYLPVVGIEVLISAEIAAHKNDPQSLVTIVRNWLNNQARLNAPAPSRVWGAFLEFMGDSYDTLKERGFSDQDIEELPVDELITGMRSWCLALAATWGKGS